MGLKPIELKPGMPKSEIQKLEKHASGTQSRLKSGHEYLNLKQVMPGGVSSPIRSNRSVGYSLPLICEKGCADMIFDVDGNSYVDFCSSFGALIAGHAPAAVVQVLEDQIRKGTSYACSTVHESKLAGLICSLIPSIEKVRFCASGTEATMTAVRLAREVTKRRILIRFEGNYHGHSDTTFEEGNDVIILPYNDLEAVEKVFSSREDIACVIVEPIAANMGVVIPKKEFLELLRKRTLQAGALLIFDEVVTGFRVANFSSQALFGIQADITTLGKIVGGGLPLGALGGKKEYMDFLAPLGPVYHAGTHSGNPLSTRAGSATLEMLQVPGFYRELERKTRLLVEPISQFIKQSSADCCLQRQDSLFTIFFGQRAVNSYNDFCKTDKALFAEFFHYMFDNGYFIPPSQGEAWFVTAAHTDEHLMDAADCVIEFLKRTSF